MLARNNSLASGLQLLLFRSRGFKVQRFKLRGSTMATTRQTIQLASKEGKAFLRKVIKHNATCSMREDWSLRASPATDWKVVFERTIPGEVGEPDEEVIVTTDQVVTIYGKTGAVKSFDDSQEVIVCEPRRVNLNGETPLAAKLLLDGFSLEVHCSSGSTSSSRHGLSFYTLTARNRELSHYSLTIGGETVAKDGQQILSSVVGI